MTSHSSKQRQRWIQWQELRGRLASNSLPAEERLALWAAFLGCQETLTEAGLKAFCRSAALTEEVGKELLARIRHFETARARVERLRAERLIASLPDGQQSLFPLPAAEIDSQHSQARLLFMDSQTAAEELARERAASQEEEMARAEEMAWPEEGQLETALAAEALAAGGYTLAEAAVAAQRQGERPEIWLTIAVDS